MQTVSSGPFTEGCTIRRRALKTELEYGGGLGEGAVTAITTRSGKKQPGFLRVTRAELGGGKYEKQPLTQNERKKQKNKKTKTKTKTKKMSAG